MKYFSICLNYFDNIIILEYFTTKVKPKSKHWFYLGLTVKDDTSRYGLSPVNAVCRDENSLPPGEWQDGQWSPSQDQILSKITELKSTRFMRSIDSFSSTSEIIIRRWANDGNSEKKVDMRRGILVTQGENKGERDSWKELGLAISCQRSELDL